MKIKYSFIVPVYGCEKYLESCVESILAQKGDHVFEVILVDDGSKDGGGRIADELAARDSRVRTFHKENGGAASARNFGIREARGEYILFVDGDDTVEDQLLTGVDEVLREAAETLVIFGISFDYYRKEALVRSEVLSCGHEGSFSVKELLEDYSRFFHDNALSSACNKVFPAKLLKANTLWMQEGMTLYEDYDFVLRCLAHTETVTCIARPYYHYRNDLQNAHINRRLEDIGKLRQDLRQLLQSSLTLSCDSIQLREVSANLYLQLLWQHLTVKSHPLSELEQCLTQYCEEPAFCTLLAKDVKLNAHEAQLLCLVREGKYREIDSMVKRRNAKARLKGSIKALLRFFGLRK